ncbi:MAG TPA: HEAT repeat domain-containing protein [Anaerolineales bacterium]
MPGLKTLLADLMSGDEARAEAAVPALVRLGEKVLPALREEALSKDPEHRWWAVRVLAELPQTRAGELAFFLRDPAAEVRQAAALGLAAHPDETILPDLIRTLHDPDPLTASLAGNALVKNGPAAVPALLAVLNEERQEVRILALRALVELKDQRSIPAMLKLVQEDSAIIVHWAQEGLERLGLNMVYIKPT